MGKTPRAKCGGGGDERVTDVRKTMESVWVFARCRVEFSRGNGVNYWRACLWQVTSRVISARPSPMNVGVLDDGVLPHGPFGEGEP